MNIEVNKMDKNKIKIILLEIFLIILSIVMIYCIVGLFIIELLFGIVSIILLLLLYFYHK